jgi:Tfp pilus assembly protein PilW
MTLTELMITTAVASMAFAGLGALSIYTARSYAAMSNYMELDKNSRNALDRLTQIVREADGVASYDNHSVVLSYHGQELSFNYSPEAKTMTMIDTNGVSRVLLEDCDFLNFEAFQRNSVPGTYDQYPAAEDESAAKLVQVSWICSRSLIGNLLNTESVQSAKIVIRKQ